MQVYQIVAVGSEFQSPAVKSEINQNFPILFLHGNGAVIPYPCIIEFNIGNYLKEFGVAAFL